MERLEGWKIGRVEEYHDWLLRRVYFLTSLSGSNRFENKIYTLDLLALTGDEMPRCNSTKSTQFGNPVGTTWGACARVFVTM